MNSTTLQTQGTRQRYAIRFHLTISRTFHILFKFLFIFPSRYLFAIGLSQIFSFRRTLPPDWRCSPKQHDSLVGGPSWGGSDGTGLLPSPARYLNNELHPTPVGPPTQATTRRPREAAAFQVELVPLHSPLLGDSWLVSFPPRINMFKFSGSSRSSSALCGEDTTGGISESQLVTFANFSRRPRKLRRWEARVVEKREIPRRIEGAANLIASF